jgi:hypothetical protein
MASAVYRAIMSDDHRAYEILFSDRYRWARTFTNPLLRHRMLRWATEGGPLDIDIVGPICEEVERLTELERRLPRPPKRANALWSDRNAAVESVAVFVPLLAARLREWVADDYPTEVDDLVIGLAEQLAETEERLVEAEERVHDERCYRDDLLDEARRIQDELREEIARLEARCAVLPAGPACQTSTRTRTGTPR